MKAKLEAGESPGLDPLLPAPYQALVQAGLGLEPADRRGSLQSTRYLLRKAMAKVQEGQSGVGTYGTLSRTHVTASHLFPQDSAPKLSSPAEWTALSPVTLGSRPG